MSDNQLVNNSNYRPGELNTIIGNIIQIDSKPRTRNMRINNHGLRVEIDCGACANVISQWNLEKVAPDVKLMDAANELCTADGNQC